MSLEKASRRAMEMLSGKTVGEAIPEDTIAFLPGSMILPKGKMADLINRAVLNHEPVAITTKGIRSLRLEALCNAFKAAGIQVPLDSNGIPQVPQQADRNVVANIIRSIGYPRLILWGDHVYTVISFDPLSNIITLRNPFGTDDPSIQWPGTADIDVERRNKLIQDLGEGFIRIKLDVLYPFIRKLVWTDL